MRLKLDDAEMSGEEFRIKLGLPSAAFRLEKNGDGIFVITSGNRTWIRDESVHCTAAGEKRNRISGNSGIFF